MSKERCRFCVLFRCPNLSNNANKREFRRKKVNHMLINQLLCDEVLHSAALKNFKRQDQKVLI